MSAVLDKAIVANEPASGDSPSFRLSNEQRNAIAMMSVSGTPVADIARAVGRSTAVVRNAIKEDGDLQARIAHYESKLLRTMAVHHFEMLSMLDQARRNIQEGLVAPDLKVRLDTSWRLTEAVVPKAAQRLDVNLEVSGETRHEIAAAAIAMTGTMAELKERQVGGQPSYLRSVKEALPGPSSLPKEVEEPA